MYRFDSLEKVTRTWNRYSTMVSFQIKSRAVDNCSSFTLCYPHLSPLANTFLFKAHNIIARWNCRTQKQKMITIAISLLK